jgi:hypothetical protein
VPFLDINANDIFDKEEPKVIGLNLRISGGRLEKNYRDSTICISELEPFTPYYLELDRSGFQNVSWQIPKPIISVTVNPNQYKNIQIPIKVMGEVSGMVYVKEDSVKKGLGRMVVLFLRPDSSFVAKTLTEQDGYFSFLGIPPGEYLARIEIDQLKSLNMIVAPATVPFEIKQSIEGDQAAGLEFTLTPRQPLRKHDN